MISDKDLREAIERISRTPDGELLYRYCQRKVLEVGNTGTGFGALQTHHGERIFATRLMDLMRKGIDAAAGRSGLDDKPTDRPIVFGSREPDKSKQRSYREWAEHNDPELARRSDQT